ncbi:MAG: ABC transporter ATP-binding protein [Bacteroidales bacterium]|nr:ABC transporter ATP-binding protein [Bacteroidales bacterium]
MSAYIELKDICKSFSDGRNQVREVLSHLDLCVEKGEFVSITGVSGSGKTTLLSVLGLLLQPEHGSYLLKGEDIYLSNKPLHNLRNQEIGFVFQDFRLLPQLTALDNILLPVLASKQESTMEEEAYALELMDFMGIQALKDQYPETLSGGEKTRVSICRALIQHPSLLLADEPTGQLDAENAQLIASLFQQINIEMGTTIIMVTHSAEMAHTARKQYKLVNGHLDVC